MKTNHTYYKQIKQIISIALILYFFNSNIYSQTLDLYDVEYNYSQIPNCSSIDLNLNTEHYITFKVRFEQPYFENSTDNVNITGDVLIQLGALGTTITLVSHHINTNSWTINGNYQYFELTGLVSISNSQLNDDGGTLSALYDSTYIYESCDYNITRPEYILSPSSSSISCGQSSATFSVSDVHNSPGSLEYHWNVGNGWKRNGSIVHTFTTTTNNIDLEPYQFPPSNVSVTPYLDGVPYNTLTSVVHLSEFTTTNDILGQDAICSSGNYQLENNLPNDYNVEWSIDNPFLASLVVNGQTVTIQAINNQNGPLVLSAKITNSCNQFVTITKTIYIGAPDVPVSLMHVLGGWDNVPAGTTSQLHVNWIPDATAYKWTIQNINHTGTGTFPYFVNYGGNPNATTIIIPNSTYIDIQWGTLKGEYVINCWAINNCAQTPIGHKIVNVFDSSNNPCPPMGPIGINPIWDKTANIKIKVYPNPIGNNDVIYVNKIDPSLGTGPCNNSDYYGKNVKTKNILNIIKIYDKKGKLLFEKAYQKDQIKIKDLHLKSDTYFLVLQDSNGNMERTTLIVK